MSVSDQIPHFPISSISCLSSTDDDCAQPAGGSASGLQRDAPLQERGLPGLHQLLGAGPEGGDRHLGPEAEVLQRGAGPRDAHEAGDCQVKEYTLYPLMIYIFLD